MRSSLVACARGFAALIAALLLSLTFAPAAALADGEATLPLVSEFETARTVIIPAEVAAGSSVATITTGTVQLAAPEAAGDEAEPSEQTIPTVATTWVVRGCVYALDAEAGTFALVNAANGEADAEGALVVPEGLVLDGTTYPITSIAPGAFAGTAAPLVALSSAIKSIDPAAFGDNTAVQAIFVSPSNEAYASHFGVLYERTADALRPMLIPGGMAGAVRIPSGAEVCDPETFSHCFSSARPSVDADSAAPTSPANDSDTELADSASIPLIVESDAEAQAWRSAGFTNVAVEPQASDQEDSARAVAFAASEGGSDDQGETAGTTDYGTLAIAEEAFAAASLPVDKYMSNAEFERDGENSQVSVFALNERVTYDAASYYAMWRDVSNMYRRLTTDGGTTWTGWEQKAGDGGWTGLSADKYTSYRFYNGHFWLRGNSNQLISRWGSTSSGGTWDHAYVRSTDTDGAYTEVTASSSYTTIPSTDTLYIVLYKDDGTNKVPVTLDHRGGGGGTTSPVYLEFPSAQVPTLEVPTLSGWTFRGYTDDFSSQPYLYVKSNGAPTTRVKVDKFSLAANWTKTVTLNANSGSAGSLRSVTAGIGRTLGSTCTQVDSSHSDYPIRSLFTAGITDSDTWAPTRTGYTFGGYYNTSASTGGTCYISASGVAQSSCAPVTSSMPSTLYARWNANTYSVSFVANGGSGGQTANVTATYGSAMPTISATPPTRTGYIFDGWYHPDGTKYYDASGESARNWDKTEATYLIAHWTPRPYTIEYWDKAGEQKLGDDQTVDYDETLNLLDVSEEVVLPEGMEARGWADEPGQTKAKYGFGLEKKNLATGEEGNTVKKLYLAVGGKPIRVHWYSGRDDAFFTAGENLQSSTESQLEYDPDKTLMELLGKTPDFALLPIGWVLSGWMSTADEEDILAPTTPCPLQDVFYQAIWAPIISADVPLSASVRVDLLGIEAQQPMLDADGYQAYIESRSYAPIKVAEVTCTPQEGALVMFGDQASNVSLQMVTDAYTGATIDFPLDDATAEADPDKLAPLRIDGDYGARKSIGYLLGTSEEALATAIRNGFIDTETAVAKVTCTLARADI